MNLIMYGLQAPSDYKLRSTPLNHKLYIKKKEFFLVPNKFDEGIINPETFLELKEEMKIKSIPGICGNSFTNLPPFFKIIPSLKLRSE